METNKKCIDTLYIYQKCTHRKVSRSEQTMAPVIIVQKPRFVFVFPH